MRPAATIVIPTFNEEGNIGKLLGGIHSTLADAGVFDQIIVVDDSPASATIDAVHHAAEQLCSGNCTHLQVNTIWRGSARDSLAGAVIDGVKKAESDTILVMDGDGQHPASAIPSLLSGVAQHQVAIASRYVEGGSAGGLSSNTRHRVSHYSTRLAHRILSHSLRGVTDPMTGFFAFQRDAVQIDSLNRRGFKILVSILGSDGDLTRTEVPFKMEERGAGESKASVKQGIQFLQQLVELRLAGAR